MQILMTMEPTGLCNAEGKNLKRYYDKCPDSYSKYRENTSILIPMIGYKYVPMFLKRTIFFDFEKYEYKPKSESDGSAKNEWVDFFSDVECCTSCCASSNNV